MLAKSKVYALCIKVQQLMLLIKKDLITYFISIKYL